MATRETIMTALVAQLAPIQANGVALVACGRRVRDPENVPGDQRPALYLVEHGDAWERVGINVPAKRVLTVYALLYTDVGQNESLIPMTQVNLFIEAIEAALAPDDVIRNTFTLGQLVTSCMLKGDGWRAAGDTTGKSVTAIPIEIILP